MHNYTQTDCGLLPGYEKKILKSITIVVTNQILIRFLTNCKDQSRAGCESKQTSEFYGIKMNQLLKF